MIQVSKWRKEGWKGRIYYIRTQPEVEYNAFTHMLLSRTWLYGQIVKGGWKLSLYCMSCAKIKTVGCIILKNNERMNIRVQLVDSERALMKYEALCYLSELCIHVSTTAIIGQGWKA